MTDVLHVQRREKTGTANCRRMRRSGYTPAILYGHGEDCVNLAIPTQEIAALMRHHGRTVKLAGDVESDALVKDVQFDPLGIEVLHLDFYRVSLDEAVEVEVPLHAHGEVADGMLHELMHEIEISCPAGKIPNEIEYSVNDWQIGRVLTAGELKLPEGATLLMDAETPVAQVEEVRAEPIEGEEEAVTTEPEVIGGREEQEESEEG